MPSAQIASKTGPVELYYEDTGRGFPLVWCHEFGGDYRSWEYQVRYFSRRYRVVTWNYRGYPPSDVPKDADAYSVDILVEDLRGLLQHLGISKAHVGGLSMGGGVALNFGVRYPEMCESLIIAGAGSGTVNRDEFLRNADRNATLYETEGAEAKARNFASNPTRQGFAVKDPARLDRIPEQRARPLRHRLGAHDARRADEAEDDLRDGARAAEADGAVADRGGRPGRALPGARACS